MASTAGEDPFVRHGVAPALARRLREAVIRVGVEEVRKQDEQFDNDSRLGRELLYLASNDEWIRSTRERVSVEAADTVSTTVQVHVDLGRITHETFRNREERVWLPLVVLPPPPEIDDAVENPLALTPGRIAAVPLATDQGGNLLPVLPQSEARRWIAAALAEIFLNMAPVRLDVARGAQHVGRELAREQQLLLSAALFRVLQRRTGAGEFSVASQRSGLDPEGAVEAARGRLTELLDVVITTLGGSDQSGRERTNDRAALVMQRAARIIFALSSPTTLVVIAAPPTAMSTVYTVDLASRPLHTNVPRFRGPRAQLTIDALLPGTEADRSIVVRLPEGVSFTGHEDDRTRPWSVRATVEGVQPRSLRQVIDLIGQLRQPDALLPDPVARCLVDFTLARMEVARDAFRNYRATPEAARVSEAGQVDSVPAWLDEVRHGLEEIRADGSGAQGSNAPSGTATARSGGENGSAAEQARRAARLAPDDLSASATLYRINESDAVSPHRAHVQLPAVENRTGRATPVGATITLDVVADRSAPLHAARYAGYMSLILLGAVLVCWLAFSRERALSRDVPDAQVLASVLTLFAAVQASRIQHPERATLRGLLISSGSWLVIASILPTVLLGVTLAFDHSSTAIIVVAVAIQAGVQALMYLPPLTGQPWRWSLLSHASAGRTPRLQLSTGPAPDYRRTSVLLSSWWRSTTAAALQLGAEAYGYLVVQHGGGLTDLLGTREPADRPDNGSAVSTPRGPSPRTAWMNLGRDLIGNRLPRALASFADAPARPANILAMLRSGAPRRPVTFVVFREEPQPEWQQNARVRVDLDVDRLIAHEAAIADLEVYIGLERHELLAVETHPVRRFLALARRRRLQIPAVQFPAAPPPGGSPGRHWTKITIGLRSSEVAGLGDLLTDILDRVRDAAGESVDLLVDMSTQTPPRRFLGSFTPDERFRPAAMRPEGLDARRSLPDSDDEWVTVALCDYAQDGVESRLLRSLERDFPGLALAGLTIARLFGTTAVFALGRRPPGSVPPSTARVLVAEPVAAEDLGRLPAQGVLLGVRARYSDRPGILAELLKVLRHSLAAAVGHGDPAADLELPYLETAVADGRNAVTTFTVCLGAPANGGHFTPAVLDRIEREVRRGLVSRLAGDPSGDDLGVVHAVRMSIGIDLITAQRSRVPPAAEAGSADVMIDLDAGAEQPAGLRDGESDAPAGP